MRKNRMMRAASALMVAVLLTTSTISGTFAKYTTQDTAKDEARVARWGVELQVAGNLFGDSYGNANKIVDDGHDSVTVQSINHTEALADVVAPGTENDSEGFGFSINGQPEVDGKITTDMTIQNIFLKEGTYGVMIKLEDGVVTKGNYAEFFEVVKNEDKLYILSGSTYVLAPDTWQDSWVDDSTTPDFYTLEDLVTLSSKYYPVVFSLKGATATVPSEEVITVDSLKKAADRIRNQLGLVEHGPDSDTSVTYDGTTTFAANKDLATFAVNNLNLSWKWKFENGETPEEIAMYNGADTILGHLMAKEAGQAIKVVKLTNTDEYAEIIPATDEYVLYCLDVKFILDVTVEQVD